jgi:hypothetical protein
VIDVAGSSNALTPIFELLHQFLAQIETVDGFPLVEKPKRILDYSEISANFSFSLDALIPQPMRKILTSIAKGPFLVPTLIIQPVTSEQTLAGTAANSDSHAFTLAPRSSSQPEDHIYFSGAPLDSEAHLKYLKEWSTAMA